MTTDEINNAVSYFRNEANYYSVNDPSWQWMTKSADAIEAQAAQIAALQARVAELEAGLQSSIDAAYEAAAGIAGDIQAIFAGQDAPNAAETCAIVRDAIRSHALLAKRTGDRT